MDTVVAGVGGQGCHDGSAETLAQRCALCREGRLRMASTAGRAGSSAGVELLGFGEQQWYGGVVLLDAITSPRGR
ncbi:hypothetical protein J7E96_05530 [Streptomyces sp. ISL-96]|uniref:hypothetical protein n=1 Tax=Streptomyces sp. ISL-96 TaxID=2819191 RepID=UPI001BEBC84E|nr:hypothetical protein [Streptomyces sp. ISL-96]MBT2488003.1 hypothetical protein [Streptomyces sp. ISL-96]